MKRLELKVSFVNDYKNLPPNPGIKKNDTALIAAILFKI